MVSERMATLAPYQQEVERHVSQLSAQLMGVVAGECGSGLGALLRGVLPG